MPVGSVLPPAAVTPARVPPTAAFLSLQLILICFVVVLAWSGVCLLMLGFQPTGPMHPARAFLIRQWVTFWARFVLFVGGFYYIPGGCCRNEDAAMTGVLPLIGCCCDRGCCCWSAEGCHVRLLWVGCGWLLHAAGLTWKVRKVWVGP